MSKEVLVSMLRKGQNGEEILTILDMIVGSDDTNSAEPTLEEIDFWLAFLINQGVDNSAPIL